MVSRYFQSNFLINLNRILVRIVLTTFENVVWSVRFVLIIAWHVMMRRICLISCTFPLSFCSGTVEFWEVVNVVHAGMSVREVMVAVIKEAMLMANVFVAEDSSLAKNGLTMSCTQGLVKLAQWTCTHLNHLSHWTDHYFLTFMLVLQPAWPAWSGILFNTSSQWKHLEYHGCCVILDGNAAMHFDDVEWFAMLKIFARTRRVAA